MKRTRIVRAIGCGALALLLVWWPMETAAKGADPFADPEDRLPWFDFELDQDYAQATDADYPHIVMVPKGKTYTVMENATLCIVDDLKVIVKNYYLDGTTEEIGQYYRPRMENKGRIVNNGTIILEPQTSSDPDEEEHTATLNNSGTLENNGTIYIRGGLLEVLKGGTLINNGLIVIEKVGYFDAIRCFAEGSIVNEGVIHVAAKEGSAVRLFKGASVANHGSFVQAADGQVRGSVSGNAVKTDAGYKPEEAPVSHGIMRNKDLLEQYENALRDGEKVLTVNLSQIPTGLLKSMGELQEEHVGHTTLHVDVKNENGALLTRLALQPNDFKKYANGKEYYFFSVDYYYLNVHISGDQADAAAKRFTRAYGGNCASLVLEQKAFDGPVTITAKLDLSGMKADQLRLYRYNATLKRHVLVEDAKVKVSKNGFVSFATTIGGELIVTDTRVA